jgi:ATP-binding cassette, subfamily B, bacterial MsbA
MIHLLKDHKTNVGLLVFLSFLLAFITTLTAALSGPMLAAFFSSDAQSLKLEGIYGLKLDDTTGWVRVVIEHVQENLVSSLLVVAGFKFLLSTSIWFGWERIGERIALRQREGLVNHYIEGSSDASTISEQLSTLVTTDVRILKEFVVHFYGGIPREGLSAVFLIGFLAYLDSQLFMLLVFCILPLGFFLKKVGKNLSRRTSLALKDFTTLSEWIQLRLSGIETIKHLGTEELEINAMHSKNSQSAKQFLIAAHTKALSGPLSEFFAIAGLIAVLSFTMYTERRGDQIMAFFASLAMLSQSLGKLTRYFNTQREAKAAWQRLGDFKKSLQTEGERKFPTPRGQAMLELDRVVIAHYSNHTPMFQPMSFKCMAGQLTIIKGPSGIGKSSLFKSICGILDFKGQIFRPESAIALIPQDCHLVPCTLGVNISYPELSFDTQKAVDALKKAGLSEFCRVLDSSVPALSGGQKQRIHLARLFYHEPKLVLIDEGTSALDIDTERFFMANLKALIQKGCAVLMIAHRPSVLEFADQIIDVQPA